MYLLLSPYDNEKYELLHRTNEMRELERLPAHKALLELFIRQELIFWQQTIEGEYAKILFKEQSSKAVLEDQLLPSTRVSEDRLEFGNFDKHPIVLQLFKCYKFKILTVWLILSFAS